MLLNYALFTQATTMVRDSEMENVIIEAISPIVKASGASGKINLLFIQDPQINAFTPVSYTHLTLPTICSV